MKYKRLHIIYYVNYIPQFYFCQHGLKEIKAKWQRATKVS